MDTQIQSLQQDMRVIRAFLDWTQSQSVSAMKANTSKFQTTPSPTFAVAANLFLGPTSMFASLQELFTDITTLEDLNTALCNYTAFRATCTQRLAETNLTDARRQNVNMISATLRSFYNMATAFRQLVSHAQACISRKSLEAAQGPCQYIRDALTYFQPLADIALPAEKDMYQQCLNKYNELATATAMPEPAALSLMRNCDGLLQALITRVSDAIDGFEKATDTLLDQYPCQPPTNLQDQKCPRQAYREQEQVVAQMAQVLYENGDDAVLKALGVVSNSTEQFNEPAVENFYNWLVAKFANDVTGEEDPVLKQEARRFMDFQRELRTKEEQMQTLVNQNRQLEYEQEAVINTNQQLVVDIKRVKTERDQALRLLSDVIENYARQESDNNVLMNEVTRLQQEKQAAIAEAQNLAQDYFNVVQQADHTERQTQQMKSQEDVAQTRIAYLERRIRRIQAAYNGRTREWVEHISDLYQNNQDKNTQLLAMQRANSQQRQAAKSWKRMYFRTLNILLIAVAVYLAWAAAWDDSDMPNLTV